MEFQIRVLIWVKIGRQSFWSIVNIFLEYWKVKYWIVIYYMFNFDYYYILCVYYVLRQIRNFIKDNLQICFIIVSKIFVLWFREEREFFKIYDLLYFMVNRMFVYF